MFSRVRTAVESLRAYAAVTAVLILVSALVRLDAQTAAPSFSLVDVTKAAGITFTHQNGAFGRKYLPETLGAGAAFLDYDNDGRQDILLVNGTVWPGQKASAPSYSRLYRNNGNGSFTDVTRKAGLEIELYGMGVAAADFDNDGFQDILLTAVGQNHLFRNTGKGTFEDVTARSGLGNRIGFSTSALWFDYDRDGWVDLLVCNYVQWTPDTDVPCSVDGKQKSYCTPEAYRGTTSWLFRNKHDGTFEDVTAKARLFDTTSKSLGVTMLDYDVDGWPDVFIANDTEANKLYRNNRDGTFTELGLQAGLAFSEEGRARAGMGVDAADLDNSGKASVVVTNFSGEMLGLYKPVGGGQYSDVSPKSDVGRATRQTLGFGCFFFDVDLDGAQDLLVVNGHIDETITKVQARVTYAEPPHLFLNRNGSFRDVAGAMLGSFSQPKVGRGAAFGDFDGDGDPDVVITSNGGPAFLYRNDVRNGNHVIRFQLQGTKSNRDAIGAKVRVTMPGGQKTSRMVKTGSSYLSQSELPLSFGLGANASVDGVVVEWPSGARESLGALQAGRTYTIVEGRGVTAKAPLR